VSEGRVTVSRDGRIAVVTIDNPPVNALSPAVAAGIGARLAEAAADPAVRGIVLIGAGRTFVAGADIREFEKVTLGGAPLQVGRLLEIFGAIENCPRPVVCAMHGTALGGGLELAQACHWRVAAAGTQLGQPEVKLGLIPGAGGTQRLPRLIGVSRAALMCAVGEPVTAADALAWGLLDRIVDGDLLAGARAFLLEAGRGPRRTRDAAAAPGPVDEARAQAARRLRGQTAPLRAIELVELAARLPFDEGLRRESEAFRECLYGPQSRALVHFFFAEREARKVPGLPKEAPPFQIRRAGVVGAGTMGGGIAMVYAGAGIPVVVREASRERLDLMSGRCLLIDAITLIRAPHLGYSKMVVPNVRFKRSAHFSRRALLRRLDHPFLPPN
jgi:3-hydroxyacyl-CoA dehydrogenase